MEINKKGRQMNKKRQQEIIKTLIKPLNIIKT